MAVLLAPPTKNAVQKTLAAQLLNTAGVGDPITFDDVDGVPNLPGVLVIRRVDNTGVATPSFREYIEYSGTSGTTVLITTRNVDGSNSALTHPVGSIVEFIPDVIWADRIYDALSNVIVPGTLAVDTTKIAVPTALVANDNGIDIEQIATPANPSAGRNKIYFKSGGKARILDSSGVEVPLSSSLTNTVTSHATPSINTDACDIFTITAQAEAITSMTSGLSGTPVNGQKLIIRILDNGTARAITWGTSFASRGATLPTTTVLSKYLYVGLIYNSTASKWDCVAVVNEA